MRHYISNKYIITLLLCATLLLAGCQSDRSAEREMPQEEQQEQNEGGTIENSPVTSILPGQVVIKVKPEDLQGLRSSGMSLRATSEGAQQSFKEIGAVAIKPLFADYEEYRERRHKAGLDRWMVVTFEGNLSSIQAKEILSKAEAFEYVELQYATALPESKVTIVSPDAVSNTRAGGNMASFNDPLLPSQWHYFNRATSTMPMAVAGADINLSDAWLQETGKPEVVVCVVDAGIDYNHEDLASHFDLDKSYSFVIDRKTRQPKGQGQIESRSSSHGTHVAGTIAAVNNNGIGVSGVAGGNGEEGTGVTIINAQIFGAKGEDTMAGVNGIAYGADHGAVISQNSWGYTAPGPGKMLEYDKEAIDYFIKYAGTDEEGNQLPDSPMKGGIVIFAAGNDGLEYSNYPGAYEGCVSVASYGWGFKKAPYSNFGTWVDITAPGGDQELGEAAGVLSTLPNNKYGYMQGTSMACPHVSGIAALIVSKFGGQGFTNEMLKERLLGAIRPYDIYSFNPIFRGKLGTGYIDAGIALLENGGKVPDIVTDVKVQPSYIVADFSWAIAKDPDAPNGQAYYYNLYISEKEISESNPSIEPHKVYANNRTMSKAIQYRVSGLTDATKYYYAVEAVDYFGQKSKQMTRGSFETMANKAPEIIDGLPKMPVEMANNQVIKLSLKVTDPDQHAWTYTLKGDLYGVKHYRNGEIVEMEIAPIQAIGTHQLTLVLTDEYGKSSENVITYTISQYQPVSLIKSLGEETIGVNEEGKKVDLNTLFKKQAGATLSFTASSESPEILSVALEGSMLSLQPKAKGRAIIQVTATDGITTDKVALHYLVR